MSLRRSFLCDLGSVKSNVSGGIRSEDPMMKASHICYYFQQLTNTVIAVVFCVRSTGCI